MFATIKTWLSAARRNRELLERGYGFAMTRLVETEGRATPDLAHNVDAAYDFGDYSMFDAGIERAISDYERLTGSGQ
jgi:hypothetical protein